LFSFHGLKGIKKKTCFLRFIFRILTQGYFDAKKKNETKNFIQSNYGIFYAFRFAVVIPSKYISI